MKRLARESNAKVVSHTSLSGKEHQSGAANRRAVAGAVEPHVCVASMTRGTALHTKHVDLLTQAKAIGAVQTHQFLDRLQRQYGNRYVQGMLRIAQNGKGGSRVYPESQMSSQRKSVRLKESEKEEDVLQAKPMASAIQAQQGSDEEEEAKPLVVQHKNTTQRQEVAEEEEETVQMKPAAGTVFSRTGRGATAEPKGTNPSLQTRTFGNVIQLSPLSDEVRNLWDFADRRAFYARLRSICESDPDVHDFVRRTLTGDDLWLALNLLNYTSEDNWPLGPRIEREYGRGYADYSFGGQAAALQAIHSASLAERRAVLNDTSQLNAIRHRAGANALVIVAALLEGSLQWRGPSGADPAQQYRIAAGSDFANWILGRNERRNRPTPTSTMNCWEGVMFAAYLAGRATYAQLLDLHDRMAGAGRASATQAAADATIRRLVQQVRSRTPGLSAADAETTAREYLAQRLGPNYAQRLREIAGSQAYNDLLRREFGTHVTTPWRRGTAPPAGNLVFFRNDPIVHVAISLGTTDRPGNRSQVMSLWTQPGGITSFQRTTIEEILAVLGAHGRPVKYGPSPW